LLGCLLHFIKAEATNDVIIYHADCLHECIANSRANEVEAPLLQVFAYRVGKFGTGRQFGQGSPRILLGLIIDITPDESIERTELIHDFLYSSRISDRRFNLQAIVHNAGVCKKTLDIYRRISGDLLRIKSVERLAIVLSFLGDR
jgi:hypothetical protein